MRVCIISATNVTQEPRVLRQVYTFKRRGWTVCLVGYKGTQPIPDGVTFVDLERPPESQPIQESANLEEVEEISDPKSGFLPEFGHFATVLRSYARSQLHKLDDDSVIRKVLLSGWHCASAFLNWLKNRLASNTIEPGKNWQHHSTSGSIDYYLSLAVPGEMGVEVAEEIILTSSLGEKFLINALPNIPCVDLVVAHDYFTIPFASIVCEKKWV